MTVRKSTKKPTGKTTKKKAPTRKSPAKKEARAETKSTGAAPVASEPASKPEPKPRGANSSLNVNMGQIFRLRPRIQTSFRPGDLQTARHLLSEEDYDSPEAAARAVAEKALELTRKGSSKRGFKPSR